MSKKKNNKNIDLTIAGPGSPISLQKILDTQNISKPFSLFIDGTGQGIAHDAKEFLYITPEECSKQSIWYSKNMFDGKHISQHLWRWISFMMLDKEYQKPEDFIKEVTSGKITETNEDYVFIKNFIAYCEHNPEAQQVIGLIQLLAGTLTDAKKNNKSIKIYIDRPETSMHPKRQQRFMSMFYKMEKEYGFDILDEDRKKARPPGEDEEFNEEEAEMDKEEEDNEEPPFDRYKL